MNKDKLFVLSTGRVGSNYLYNKLKYRIKISHQSFSSRLINILINVFSKPLLNNLYAVTFGKIYLNASTVDPLKSQAVFFNKKNLGNSSFIHLIRDPRDFVTSFMNWKNDSFKRKILHHIVPFWQPNPWWVGECSLIEWIKMSKFEHFCWIWNYKNKLFSSIEKDENYLLVKMENLVGEKSQNELEKIYDFIGCEYDNQSSRNVEKVNKSKSYSFPKWTNWEIEKKEILIKHCGALMKKYGYGLEDKWLEKINEK